MAGTCTRSPACGCGETCSCVDCKCGSESTTASIDQTSVGQTYCKCGENCNCNPCSCSKIDETASGKSYCKCGENCACGTCSCARAQM